MSANAQPPTVECIPGRVLISLAEPWWLLPRAYDALWVSATTKMQAGVRAEIEPEPRLRYQPPVEGVAIIPIYGTIARKPTYWERMLLGVIGQQEIAAELDRALNDSSVRAVLLDIDSPGGHVMGNPELAEKVAEVDRKKPVVAFTSGLMASAAYFLGSQASIVVATGSAQVGCIGTVMSWLDISGYYEQMGVKREMIVNEGATFKGMGIPGTSLTKEQRALLQEQATMMGNIFKAGVTAKRRIPENAMRGQTLFGDQALAARLVDQLGNFGTAHRTAVQLASTNRL